MDMRVAIVGIIVEDKNSVERLNGREIGRASCRERV